MKNIGGGLASAAPTVPQLLTTRSAMPKARVSFKDCNPLQRNDIHFLNIYYPTRLHRAFTLAAPLWPMLDSRGKEGRFLPRYRIRTNSVTLPITFGVWHET